MPICCFHCGSNNLRLSHLRIGDVIYFLLLRYPARCRDCRLRFYLSFSRILKVRRYAKSRLAGGSRRQRLSQTFDATQKRPPALSNSAPDNGRIDGRAEKSAS